MSILTTKNLSIGYSKKGKTDVIQSQLNLELRAGEHASQVMPLIIQDAHQGVDFRETGRRGTPPYAVSESYGSVGIALEHPTRAIGEPVRFIHDQEYAADSELLRIGFDPGLDAEGTRRIE